MVEYKTYDLVTTLNFSNGTATTLWNYGNSVTLGLLSPMFLLLIAAISFMALSNQPRPARAFAGSGLVTFIIAALMFGAGLLDPIWGLIALAYFMTSIYLSSKETPFG